MTTLFETPAAVTPVDLRSDDDSGLVATAFRAPNLRWRLAGATDGVRQVAYEMERCADGSFAAPLSSGRRDMPAGRWVPWIGPELASRQAVWLRVRVWTADGVTAWSEALRVEGALFDMSDWLARPVSPVFNTGQAEPAPVPLLRRRFAAEGEVRQARLYVTSLGTHDCWINGTPVSADRFEPGWSAYRERHLYATYDVTGLLRRGENVLAAAVGDGWWRGNLTWMKRRAIYGDTTAFLAQLEIELADGSRQVVATDGSWRGGTGSLEAADIYNGTTVDLGREPLGWRDVGFDDGTWSEVIELPLPTLLEQRAMPAVREVLTITPRVEKRRPGVIAVDCGQNLTGYLRFRAKADGKAEIEVRHAEVLEDDGALHTAPLRDAKATDLYRMLPGRVELEPRFTYHGFRYAEIEGDVEVEDVSAAVLASDLPEIGHFACSDDRINRLYNNVKWSQRGNFLALPTDCPQRDERLGWTGDIQVFAQTACANFDSRAFLASWLADLAIEQWPDGRVTSTVPNVIQGHEFEYGGVGWGDAATLVPWALYEAYGDMEVLRRQFASMCAWVDWGASRLDGQGVWRGDFHLGDWLDPNAPPDRPEEATTDRDFIASSYLALSARTVAEAAKVLARANDAERYRQLAVDVAASTWAVWADAVVKTQTGCAMAIEFGIAPEADRPALGKRLAALVDEAGGRIATGFLGTPLILPALTSTGQIEAAYGLLFNEHAPGWLYQVLLGATTVWERWDAIRPDGRIHIGEMASGEGSSTMTSFNHYAYGAVATWLYRSLAGIAPTVEEPGYGLIDFAPQPGGGLTWAEASIDTPLGLATIRWDHEGDFLRLGITVPAGARGRFQVPAGWAGQAPELSSGEHAFVLERA